jgi:hypothetical protein
MISPVWAVQRQAVAVPLALLAAGAAAALAPAATFTPKTRTVKDASGDVSGSPMDLSRVSLGRASNGELRASLTTVKGFAVRTLRPKDGIPGTACLRLWTKTKPGAAPPDYLVCATATKDGKGLDASVLQERPGTTPVRVGPARASRSSSHNITLRFGQSLVGRPGAIDFAGETVPAGCARVACTDVAPEGAKVATFRLRAGAKRPGTT